MRQLYFWSLVLVLVPFTPSFAQQPDSGNPRRADSLRQRIEERFASRVQSELGLTNEQTAKLQAASKTYGARRRELRTREEALRDALSGQLQPGVAANQDSVAELTDAMIELRVASAQSARDEMKDLSKFLSPVQRARLYVMRERFYHRVRDADRHRGGERRRAKDRSWM
jgi:periplasmic protein CpxP/Spy